ncbi:hypothetical protein IWZ01DRAFT_524514 [Phyllosticta capitalensis]
MFQSHTERALLLVPLIDGECSVGSRRASIVAKRESLTSRNRKLIGGALSTILNDLWAPDWPSSLDLSFAQLLRTVSQTPFETTWTLCQPEWTKMATQDPSANRLSDDQRIQFTDLYKTLTKDFTSWLESTARKQGIRTRVNPKPKTDAEKAEWENALQYATKLREELKPKAPGLPKSDQEKFEVTATTELARQAEKLFEKKVRLPQEMLETLEQCVDLRTSVLNHYDYVLKYETIDDSRASETAEEKRTTNKPVTDFEQLEAKNDGHRFFRDVLKHIQERLIDQKYRLAMRVHKVLTEMQSRTEAVMDAWTQYRKTGQGLIRATVITEAAVHGAILDELKLQDMAELQSFHNAYCHRLKILDEENDEYPELLEYIRGLRQVEKQDPKFTSTAETLQHNLELLHYPSNLVVENWWSISRQWAKRDEKFPVPGYPVDLRYVHPGFGKGKRKLKDEKDEEEQRKRRRMKVDFEKDVQLSWKFLNELKLLQLYKVEHQVGKASKDQDGQAPGDQDDQAPDDQDDQAPDDQNGQEPGDQEVHAPAEQDKHAPENQDGPAPLIVTQREEHDLYKFPKDMISQVLTDLVADQNINFSVSYSLQLLVKICRLFDKSFQKNSLLCWKNCDDPFQVEMHRFETRTGFDDAKLILDCYLDCVGNTPSFIIKRTMEQNGTPTPYSLKCKWSINDTGQEEFHVVRSRSKQGEIVTPTVEVPINRIDRKSFPEKNVDLSWWADATEKGFYWSSQPHFIGFTLLRRRLLEYNAEIRFANSTLSIFTFSHLVQAFRILEPGDQDARQDAFIFEQEPEWFHEDSPQNATEILNMVRSRLPNNGTEYDYSNAIMHSPQPVSFLWYMKVYPDDYRPDWETFARELDLYYKKWQLREKILNGSREDRPSLYQELQQLQNAQLGVAEAKLSWDEMVEIFKKGLPVLPCGDYQLDLYAIDRLYADFLEMIGGGVGFARREDEPDNSYHARLLYFILEDFKTQEDAHKSTKAKGPKQAEWKKNTHLMKVKQYLKSKNQADKKRETERKTLRQKLEKWDPVKM